MTNQQQQAFDAMRSALEELVDIVQGVLDDKPSVGSLIDSFTLQPAHAALTAAKEVTAQKVEPQRVYLVATGEVYEGEETYTRHDKPVPLADQEVLFTSAAQQSSPTAQPLTDEQIIEVIRSTPLTPAKYAGWVRDQCIAWARAIEAAHGIGASTKEQK